MMRAAIITVALAAALAAQPDQPAAAQQLHEVKRICVAQLNGGGTAASIRDMIIAALQKSGAFMLTENADRADAVLKGSAEDLVFTETFSADDGLTARGSLGTGISTITGGKTPSVSIGERDSQRGTERKHEAFAAVRLVNRDGDVLWSTTQESLGAKFRGASADVADKVARQLLLDLERVRRKATP